MQAARSLNAREPTSGANVVYRGGYYQYAANSEAAHDCHLISKISPHKGPRCEGRTRDHIEC